MNRLHPDSLIEQQKDEILQGLIEFVRFPSISTDPEHRPPLRACADWLRDRLTSIGIEAELRETGGHPAVVGRSEMHADRPTLLIYGHYDVQPVDPLALWNTDPFEPVLRDGRLFGRGASDNKGQIWAHIQAARLFHMTGTPLPANLVFLIEGEEEIGSPHLTPVVETLAKEYQFTSVIVSDTGMPGPGQPALTNGLRGLAYFEVVLTGANTDLHSGIFGGAVPNPAQALTHMLAACKDPQTGRILIPGFYDDIEPVSEKERVSIAGVPFSDKAFQEQLGLAALEGEEGFSSLERRWIRPTFDINGLTSGFQGEGAKTVIPAEARCKVSMRLVPGQDPDGVEILFRSFLESIRPPSIQMEISVIHGARPYHLDIDHPLVEAGLQALKAGFGVEPVIIREGGSVPIVQTFKQVLGTETLLLGLGLPDDRCHAPNEKFELDNLWAGIRTSVDLLYRLGQG